MLASIARAARQAERAFPVTAVAGTSPSWLSASASTATATSKPPLLKEFQLYRFDPEKDEKPYYKTYRVDINKCAL